MLVVVFIGHSFIRLSMSSYFTHLFSLFSTVIPPPSCIAVMRKPGSVSLDPSLSLFVTSNQERKFVDRACATM